MCAGTYVAVVDLSGMARPTNIFKRTRQRKEHPVVNSKAYKRHAAQSIKRRSRTGYSDHWVARHRLEKLIRKQARLSLSLILKPDCQARHQARVSARDDPIKKLKQIGGPPKI
jgi:hypothetical protein